MWTSLALSLGVVAHSSIVAALDYSIKISSPASVPPGASWDVPHDFASFSLPAHFFADYTGNNSHPNLFSRDIFDLLYQKSGAHPFVRVGGTSTDRVWYNDTQQASQINEYDPSSPIYKYGIATSVSVGSVWFEGFNNFPGSHWTFQVNMGSDFNTPGGLDNALEVARMVMNTVQGDLDSFEIGNEPELMSLFGERPENYTLAEYVDQWNSYADAVSENVLKGNPYGLAETRFFQAFTFGGEEEPWTGLEAWQLGIDRGDHVKSVSFHQYANGNSPWVRLQNSYMNHTANEANITQYLPEIEFASEYQPFIPFVLGETNSNSYNLNMSQIEGVFGSALWLIDHLMIGMSLNITRYNLIQGVTFGYSGWVPVPSQGRDPYVRPPLYGQIFAADVLGHHPQVQIQPLNSNLPWNMSAYGVYEAGELAKYVVINFDEWNSTTPYERPVQEVVLGVPNGVNKIQVERLTGNGASADEGIEWAGMSWNYTDGRLVEAGKHCVEWLEVGSDGLAKLNIPSTEAVLVTLNSKQ